MNRKNLLLPAAAALATAWLFASAAAQPAPQDQGTPPAQSAQLLQIDQSTQPPHPAPSAQPPQPAPSAQPPSDQPPEPEPSAQPPQLAQPAPATQPAQMNATPQPLQKAPPAPPAKPREFVFYGDACAADLEKFCAGVQPGASRQRCLDAHEAESSKPCRKRRSELRELRSACEAVMASSCKDVPLLLDPMLKCLQEHEAALGEPCRKLRAAARKPAQLIIPACQGDFKKLCKDVPLTSSDVSRCLQDHEAELSGPCRAAGPEPKAAALKK